MTKLVVHPETAAELERYSVSPAHAVLLVGAPGSGKLSIARHMASQVLRSSTDKLESYPYFRHISPIEGKAIPIETIRDLQRFTTLKIPRSQGISRLAIIESAHLLTHEAQNALLKTLEEPPADTAFILTAPSADALLPTIQSRSRVIHVVPPSVEHLKEALANDFSTADIEKALLISGGLPGLTHALLTDTKAHPLYEATVLARQLLQSTTYERLLLVDSLSKQKQLCTDIAFILGQMARMALERSHDTGGKRWRDILRAAYSAQERLRHNTATKLVLMQLLLEM